MKLKMQYTCTMRFYSAAKTNEIFKKAVGTGKYCVKGGNPGSEKLTLPRLDARRSYLLAFTRESLHGLKHCKGDRDRGGTCTVQME